MEFSPKFGDKRFIFPIETDKFSILSINQPLNLPSILMLMFKNKIRNPIMRMQPEQIDKVKEIFGI